MFGFIKELFVKTSDNEKQATDEIRTEKSKIIFSRKTKRFVYIFGVLYLIMTWSAILMVMQKGVEGEGLNIIKSIFLSGCDVAAMICLKNGTKKAEIIALILIIFFLVVLYASTLFL